MLVQKRNMLPSRLTCEPDCLTLKLISKLPSLHLTPPIVKS